MISNTNFKARNLTNELNLKDLVTYFSSNLFFMLIESFLVLLHGVRDLKILFNHFTFSNLNYLIGFHLPFPKWGLPFFEHN